MVVLDWFSGRDIVASFPGIDHSWATRLSSYDSTDAGVFLILAQRLQ